ncbi:hypothetical protein ASPZODRAFT_68541 [Penicilliopsis zonata CBS 506.65]|uniref:rRNA adenine N(6)-methyltransferase n=1 Tax=Penicilliopsis zonata CBS 506.65 TaxID=1073090 RepID=A0A1L9SFB0_9EURO|nr:hypothetical protein ASPZODRAFT_68541 [Penicilliopsis zonata CBS 506.65]OJJ45886.1 hypothetical protein ASPZODRAFT_68541 [Penicilliopsis zonata CBS 506.65]
MGKAPRSKPGGGKAPYSKPDWAKSSSPIFKFNTNIGQHILKNAAIADAIVAKANIQPSDSVLEVGPGPGVLTTRILEKARKVTAVELDPRMAAELTCRVQGTPAERRLQIIVGDFVKTDLNKLPPFSICISNTPYQISSQLIFKLLSHPTPPHTSVLMVQREFALRLIARPGDSLYSRLSVNAQFFARISHVMKVGRNNFTPPPQVESSVVRIEPKTDRPAISWDEWDGMLRICFVRKNKTLRASWMATKVRALIESNWMTWAAMHPEKVLESDIAFLQGQQTDDHDGDHEMKMDTEDQDQEQESDDDIDLDFFDDGKPAEKTKHSVKADNKGSVTIGAHRVPRVMVTKLIIRKIERILETSGLSGARANKCDENDFLRLLYTCNEEGIHFS